MGETVPPVVRPRVRGTLLVLLWAWAILIFVVVDLFLDVREFDRIRPRALIYQGMRSAAHEMVGTSVEVMVASVPPAAGPSRVSVPARSEPAIPTRGASRLPPPIRAGETLAYLQHGTYTQWNDPGENRGEGSYEAGRRTGRWIWYWPDGAIREERHYQAGRLHGAVRSWYPDGNRERVEQYEAGKRVGTWEAWHDNGRLAAVDHYVSGEPDGEFVRWFADGQMAARREFAQGAATGALTLWHANGRSKVEGGFRDGKKCGVWRYWDERGTPLREEHYEDGNRVRTTMSANGARIGRVPFLRRGDMKGPMPGEEVR